MKVLNRLVGFGFCLVVVVSSVACDNDDGNAPNQNQCAYQGFSYLDTNNNTSILIPEADLYTDFFISSSNGPEVEIYKTAQPGSFYFLTTTVGLNATGTGTLSLNGNVYNVNVICQRTGNTVGDEMRFDLTANGLEAEFCVIIDRVQ
ncbi:hypothetical protein ACFSQ0_12450 [Mesonia sediminis]|uniref:Lipoprotein n=1 Tax=Mesonia sediminis TaxID=1703946 RepID=A0ABW5SHZ9_9FLAO